MTKHTPGKWTSDHGSRSSWVHLGDKDDGCVVEVSGGNHQNDADFIAEAPAMLDALRDATDALEKIVVAEEKRAKDLRHREAWMPLKFSEERMANARAAIANNRAILARIDGGAS